MIHLHPTYVLANRVAIEDEIERLIALLDTADGDTDLEPEPDAAVDDSPCDVARDDLLPLRPIYGENQTAGPINQRAAQREHHRRMMEGRA